MKGSKVWLVVDIILLVAMVVSAILYFANVWQDGNQIFILLLGASRITQSADLWNEKRGRAIASLILGVLMVCTVIVFLFV